MDEEQYGTGTEHLVTTGVDADYAIIGEPTELQTCIAQKGVVRYEVTVHGESAHTGTPEQGINAITELNRIDGAVEDYNAELQEMTSHQYLGVETITPTEISGGSAPNVVPGKARLLVDWRLLPGAHASADEIDATFDDVLSTAINNDSHVDITVERTVFARPAEISPDHELPATVLDVANECGIATDLAGFDAVTDSRFLIHEGDIPTVVLGPGSLQDAHTVDESVTVDELHSCCYLYIKLLEMLLG